jgi:hypothetical protein
MHQWFHTINIKVTGILSNMSRLGASQLQFPYQKSRFPMYQVFKLIHNKRGSNLSSSGLEDHVKALDLLVNSQKLTCKDENA